MLNPYFNLEAIPQCLVYLMHHVNAVLKSLHLLSSHHSYPLDPKQFTGGGVVLAVAYSLNVFPKPFFACVFVSSAAGCDRLRDMLKKFTTL